MTSSKLHFQEAAAAPRHFPERVNPRAYAGFERRAFDAPTWRTFDNQVQFTTLRAFSRDEAGALVHWREDLDLYTDQLQLGRWIWPAFRTVFASNFWELVAEIKQRGLFLYDIWGHVPGNETDKGAWGHVVPPEGMVERLKRELGDHFLGFDNGEQDGRFLWEYAGQQCPVPRRRIDVYQTFCHHFDRMTADLGGNLSLLVALTFPHYLAKEGSHMLLGAESAQSLPCSQVVYNFVRGAGKQYGLLWFGNASVFNRWGYKTYEAVGRGSSGNEVDGPEYGPTKGTSLSLLKRLIYVHLLYNCVAVGMENGWLVGDNVEKRLMGLPVRMETDPSSAVLSPIGVIQSEAAKFARRHGEPGVMHAPVALLLDFAAGWTVPRHLYTQRIYEVWGSHPYDEGDYLTHLVFSMLYPGYEDAGFYQDERGYLCDTPFGDMSECLLTDASAGILARYSLIIAAGTIQPSEEVKDKLRDYVWEGGRLVMTRREAAWCWPEFAGAESLGASEFPFGGGAVLLSPTVTGIVVVKDAPNSYSNECGKPLACPYELECSLESLLRSELTAQQIFAVGDGLGFVTCRLAEGHYRLAVYNNSFRERPFLVEALHGRILDCVELLVDRSERLAEGYWPEVINGASGGNNSATTIAGGDIRLFDITLSKENLRLVAPAATELTRQNALLKLRAGSVGEAYRSVLARPTFFDHYTGIVIGWRCLLGVDASILRSFHDLFGRKRLEVAVDLSDGLDYYPDLVLLDTLSFRYQESMRQIGDVFAGCRALGVRDVLFSLHRLPEGHCGEERADALFRSSVRALSALAGEHGLTLHLQAHPEKWLASYADVLAFLAQEALTNVKPAYNLCHALMRRETMAEADLSGAKFVRFSLPSEDAYGQMIDAHLPLHAGAAFELPSSEILVSKSLIYDSSYETVDEEYKDVKILKQRMNSQEWEK